MPDLPTPKTSLPAGIWKILTLKCDESTRLVSDGFERRLSRMERMALRMHLLSCRSCRRMRAQFHLLRKANARIARTTRLASRKNRPPPSKT